MSQKGLYIPDICAAFEKVGGKCVAQTVNGHLFMDMGIAGGFFKNILGGSNVEWAAVLPGKKPVCNVKTPAVFIQKGGGTVGQYSNPVFSAFCPINQQGPAANINMLHFQGNKLANPEAR